MNRFVDRVGDVPSDYHSTYILFEERKRGCGNITISVYLYVNRVQYSEILNVHTRMRDDTISQS